MTMRIHAISFNAEMALANIEGRKTHTMRPIKVQPFDGKASYAVKSSMLNSAFDFAGPSGESGWAPVKVITPPYVVGDIIWQREPGKIEEWGCVNNKCHVIYGLYADMKTYGCIFPDRLKKFGLLPGWVKKFQGIPNGIFKEACRWWGVVTDVHVMRVRDITEEQAIAEGVGPELWPPDGGGNTHVQGFASLWDSIYAKRGLGWDANPWCWGISYKACPRPDGWPAC